VAARKRKSVNDCSTTPEKIDATLLPVEQPRSLKKMLGRGDFVMILALRITLLAMLVSFLGCAGQIQPAQTSPPVAAKPQAEQQPKKTAIPTFTYRPGM
jgi:hypothetical protein